MLGLGLSLTQVAVRGGGRTFGAAIIISKNNQDENTAIGTTIGNVSVVGGTGTYTFTKTADPDSAFTFTSPALKNAIVFDYETATAHAVTIHADNGAGSVLNRTFSIGVNDIDEVPAVITSSPTQTIPENSAFSMTLTADKSVTWSKTGGADTALFTLAGATLSMAAKDFEIPTDANTDNVYVVQVTATSTAYAPATTNQTINVTVTDVTGVAPGTPTIVWTSAVTVTPPVFSFTAPSDPDLVVGDNVHFQRSTASDFSTGITDYNNTVDSTEDAANALTFTSGSWANGTWYVRARTERGEGISAWSNTETKTLAAGAGTTTLDPAHISSHATLDATHLIVTGDGSASLSDNVRSVASHTTGKYYCEFTITTVTTNVGIGVVNGSFTIGGNYVGSDNNGIAAYMVSVQLILLNGGSAGTPPSAVQGSIIGMKVDMDAQTFDVTSDGSTYSGPFSIAALGSGARYAAVDVRDPGNVITANFGPTYHWSVPTGGYGNW